MAMKESKKLVLIGAGRIAKVHTRSVLSLKGVQIAAVVDPSREAGENIASIAGGVWYPTLDKAVESESFAGAIIAAPTPLHAELIERCVGLGLPVFCEKPVDLSLARVDLCLERTKSAGVPVLIAFHRRFDTARREVHEIVRSGSLGRLEHILQISRDPRLPSESFLAHSGGMVRDKLIHDLDELVWVCGKGPVTVQADLERFVDPPLLARYDDYDTAAITIVFENGPQCQISATRRSVYGFDQRIEVFGSAGMVSCPNVHTSSIVNVTSGGFLHAPLLDNFPQRYLSAYAAEMQHFLAVLDGAEEPRCTISDARASLALAELVLKSAQSGQKVRAAGL
jgi:myo-inositol 2-dehydrogenase/D-chiro-inositol 1-dehydrogenase